MTRPNIVRRVGNGTFENDLGELWVLNPQSGWVKVRGNSPPAHFDRTLELARRYKVKSFVWRGRVYTWGAGGSYWSVAK